MKHIGPMDFGNLIAYLLPGYLSLFALTYVSTRVSELFRLSFSKDAGIGTEMALLLFALTAGVSVSACRALLLDRLQVLTGIKAAPTDYRSLTDPEKRAAFSEVVTNKYRFSQFYGNGFLALLLLVGLRTYAGISPFANWALLALFTLALAVLFAQHRGQLSGTNEAVRQILSSQATEVEIK